MNILQGAIILDGEPTENLRSNLKYFVRTFEEKYNLESWRGNVSIFSTVDELVEAAFEISLIQPLAVHKDAKQAAGKEITTGWEKPSSKSRIPSQRSMVTSCCPRWPCTPDQQEGIEGPGARRDLPPQKRGFIVPYRYYT